MSVMHMSVQSLRNGHWRVVAKTGTNPETGKPTYFYTTIKGTHQEAKNLEAEHILFNKKKFGGMTLKAYMEKKWLLSLTNATNTIDYYTETARRHIWPYIGDAIMRNIDVPLLRTYFEALPEGYAGDRLFELSLGQTGPICKEPGTDRRMRPDRAQRLFSSLCALYGLPTDVPLNHLRHTFATLQIDSGTDVATLRDLLGHSSTSTVTELYIIPREENLKRAQKSFGEIMDPRKRAEDARLVAPKLIHP